MSPRHCLVTGANGFIGRRLCEYLKLKNIEVSAIVRKKSGLGLWDHEFIGDLANEPVDHDWLRDVDAIFHLAGKTHAVSEWNDEESSYYKANVEATQNLLDAAKKSNVQHFIFFSSIKAIGEGGVHILDETASTEPESVYGKTKLEAEDLVLHGNYVECPCVLRLPLVYGNRPKGNLESMINAIMDNRFPPVPAVKNKRSMVHVDDVVQAAFLSATHPDACNQVFLVTDGKYYSTRQLYELIARAAGRQIPKWGVPVWFFYVIAKFGDLIGKIKGRRFVFDTDSLQKMFGSAWYDSSKLEKSLGFVPKHDLESALPEIIKSMSYEQ